MQSIILFKIEFLNVDGMYYIYFTIRIYKRQSKSLNSFITIVATEILMAIIPIMTVLIVKIVKVIVTIVIITIIMVIMTFVTIVIDRLLYPF